MSVSYGEMYNECVYQGDGGHQDDNRSSVVETEDVIVDTDNIPFVEESTDGPEDQIKHLGLVLVGVPCKKSDPASQDGPLYFHVSSRLGRAARLPAPPGCPSLCLYWGHSIALYLPSRHLHQPLTIILVFSVIYGD